MSVTLTIVVFIFQQIYFSLVSQLEGDIKGCLQYKPFMVEKLHFTHEISEFLAGFRLFLVSI